MEIKPHLREIIYVSAVTAIAVTACIYNAQHKPPTITQGPDPRYLSLVEKVRADSAVRLRLEAKSAVLQGKIDSLDRLSKRLAVAPVRVLDSAAGIQSIRRDSLICTDEKTYRRLVVSSLNFGEQKYSLCLGQLAAKDSVLEVIDTGLQKALTVAEDLDIQKREISLHLETEKQRRYHWLIAGLAAGIGVGLLAIYAAH